MNHTSSHRSQANLLLQQGRYADAIALYEQALATGDRIDASAIGLGLAWMLLGEVEQAQAIWWSALAEQEPDQAEVWLSQLSQTLQTEAQRQCEQGALHPAVSLYEQGLELADDPEIHHNLGQVLAQLGRLDEAIAHWQQAIAADPPVIAAYAVLGDAYQALHQWSDAIAAYTLAVTHDPDNGELRYQLAHSYLRGQQWEEAIAQLQHLLHQNPQFAPGYADLGFALAMQGRWENAIAILHQWATLSQSVIETYRGWARGSQQDWVQRNLQLLNTVQSQPDPAMLQQVFVRQFASAPDEAIAAQPTMPSSLHSYPSTPEWMVQNLHRGAIAPVHAPQLIHLRPPKTLDGLPHVSFRFGDGVYLPGTFVAELSQGRFWLAPDESSCGVITQTDTLLRDLSPEFPLLSPGHPDQMARSHRLQIESLESPQQISGQIAVLAGLSNDMYFHWMTDILPRIDLLRQAGLNLSELDGIIAPRRWPFQQETLDWLGVSAAQCLDVPRNRVVQSDRLIVPSAPGAVAWMTPQALEFLRTTFLTPVLADKSTRSDYPEKLYISRRQTANRRVINEAMLVEQLEPLGFQVVALEDLAIAEQVRLFAQARVIIAPHGGGLTNLVFCQPGTTVIELFSPNFVYPCYWYLANLANLDYYYVLGDRPFGHAFHHLLYPNGRTEDVIIPIPAVMNMLELAQVL